ncbi:MAG: hypothetical protein PWR03_1049 [Tenuifilum sp.]|uniref:hypothetical protein n=1 Tax=Tenuifilum sp. TaxID=2760880 RepID=UPI0024AB4E25|nr:hypothetical protein [Tenuifilum sp.]MDI3526866.1 hypothetical protein [Tenuifilum sp.]
MVNLYAMLNSQGDKKWGEGSIRKAEHKETTFLKEHPHKLILDKLKRLEMITPPSAKNQFHQLLEKISSM